MTPALGGLIAIAVLLIAVAAAALWLWNQRTLLLRDLDHAASEHDQAARALEAARSEAATLNQQIDQWQARFADLLAERERLSERLASQQQAHQQAFITLEERLTQQQELFKKTIESSAGDAMKQSAAHLLRLADENFTKHHAAAKAQIEQQVRPIADTLKRTDEKLADLEKQRVGAYSTLTERAGEVARASEQLRQETARLFRALSKPQVRGRYGEIQLRRVLELAGMRDYCDFTEQASTRDDADELLRPDAVVRLPNDRRIVIDAKTNLDAYLLALDAPTPEDAERHMAVFADHVAEQARRLGSKKYQGRFDGASEFVVMFIPGDQFIDAALQRRPDLLDAAAQDRVILASPSTLIGLLSAVHVGWRERRLAEGAEELRTLGKELHERVEKVLRDIARLGGSLNTALNAYNDVVGSVDARLLPTLRKFEDAGAKGEKALPEIKVIEGAARELRALPGADLHAAE
jgi:DNA recombination protein RmuC